MLLSIPFSFTLFFWVFYNEIFVTIMKEKVNDVTTSIPKKETSKKKNDKKPKPAMTAYKYSIQANPKKDGIYHLFSDYL